MHQSNRMIQAAAAAVMAAALAAGAAAARAAEAPHWRYSGETGPAHWGSEDPAFAACSTGHRQSPIDIRYAAVAALPPIEFAYRPTPLTVTDTHHSFQVNAAPGSGGIAVAGDRYELVQFHFHHPSEERIHGRRQEMVVHLVHKNAAGDLAVVAVLVREGRTNAFLKPIFDDFPAEGVTEKSVPGATLDLGQLLPESRGYYTFEGSLTTPPCSEHVRWFVLKTPVEASREQIAQFSARYAHNARPVQPLNGRKVTQTKD